MLSTVALSAASPTTTIAHFPNVQINAAKVDSVGNIYVAGVITTSGSSGAAYIARLSPDGKTTLYATTIGGAGPSTTAATALDIDSTGAAYVAGTTTATDFPVRQGAVQSSGATAFAAKLDAKGKIVYSALIGGNAQTEPSSIVVNSKGELVISGQLTSGSDASTTRSLFLLKLSADGTQSVAGPQGIGGLLAVDAQDNIYIAGVPVYGEQDPPATAGAFQQAPGIYFCGCPFFNFACGGDQFVASVTADLSRTRFLTYVTAAFGAAPAYITVDSQSDILIAGTTSAPGYPTTPDSYEPHYTAASGTVLTCGPPISKEFTSPSGYVTLVKSDGSGLVFSTFFSGSKSDTISFAALTSKGIYLAGRATSADLPGFDGAVPSQCLPVGFVTRMTSDGSTISSSRTPPGTPLAYDSTNGTLLLISGNDLLRFDPTLPTPIACVLDAADLTPVTAVAPGELLSLFGRFEYFVTDPFTTLAPEKGSFPVSFQGLSIEANQTRAPLLYASEQQINLQAPYEIAGSPVVNFALTYSDVDGNTISDSRTLNVVASNPVAFLSSGSTSTFSPLLALNADGSVNSVANPAAARSIFTVFLDGLGLTSPAPVTGMVTASAPEPLNLPVAVTRCSPNGYCSVLPTFVSVTTVPGAISGMAQVQLRAPANAYPANEFQVQFSLTVGSVAVRDPNLTVWVK